MPFTDKERHQWLEEKHRREQRGDIGSRSALTAECLHCGNPFDANDGTVTADAAICDVCLGN